MGKGLRQVDFVRVRAPGGKAAGASKTPWILSDALPRDSFGANHQTRRRDGRHFDSRTRHGNVHVVEITLPESPFSPWGLPHPGGASRSLFPAWVPAEGPCLELGELGELGGQEAATGRTLDLNGPRLDVR